LGSPQGPRSRWRAPRPGRTRGADPIETVLGFLGAQASTEAQHGIAREFLSLRESARWRDTAEVLVYDPDRVRLDQLHTDPGEPVVVRVTSRISGQVRPDGSYVVKPDVVVREDYTLVRVRGEWRLDHVPDGLRLAAADRERAYAPYPVYYLTPSSGQAPRRLVPDRVLLPVGQDLARGLVARLLQQPSRALAGSVATAVPEGTRLGGLEQSPSGVITVDLAGAAGRPSGQLAQDLSAQLVWTLRSLGASFRGLRLLLDGRPLAVPGEDDVQDAGDWDAYDPQALGPNPPYYYVANRRLRASVALPASTVTRGEASDPTSVPVDAVAVTPDRARVALLSKEPDGELAVRVGRLSGTSFPVVARGADLSSPTWGAGDRGVWLLQGHRRVVRVDDGLQEVPVRGLPAGSVTGLALSRDGVRVALVVGGRLYAGRVEDVRGRPEITRLTLVLPALHAVRAVAWGSSTELTVLGVLTRSVQVVQVAVDGSSVDALNSAGLDPTGLSACPAGVVLVAGGRLYLSTGGAFRQVQGARSTAPAFPG
jgi:hypothetical protein